MKTVSIVCKGRVQGVFFRKYTQQAGSEFGLSGWVKNQSDGSVLIHASGSDSVIDDFVKWCWEGSPLSHVEDVIVEEIGAEELPVPFETRY